MSEVHASSGLSAQDQYQANKGGSNNIDIKDYFAQLGLHDKPNHKQVKDVDAAYLSSNMWAQAGYMTS